MCKLHHSKDLEAVFNKLNQIENITGQILAGVCISIV